MKKRFTYEVYATRSGYEPVERKTFTNVKTAKAEYNRIRALYTGANVKELLPKKQKKFRWESERTEVLRHYFHVTDDPASKYGQVYVCMLVRIHPR